MNDVILHSRSGSDSKLRLEVPVDRPDTEFEIVVQIRPMPTIRVLPPGYFQLLGSVADETLQVHPQPPLPPAVNLE